MCAFVPPSTLLDSSGKRHCCHRGPNNLGNEKGWRAPEGWTFSGSRTLLAQAVASFMTTAYSTGLVTASFPATDIALIRESRRVVQHAAQRGALWAGLKCLAARYSPLPRRRGAAAKNCSGVRIAQVARLTASYVASGDPWASTSATWKPVDASMSIAGLVS